MLDINKIRGSKVGSHIIVDIDWFDFETCVLSFDSELDESGEFYTEIVCEFWEGDKSWHFMNNSFEKDSGDFIETCTDEILTDSEKERIKKIMMDYMKQTEKGKDETYADYDICASIVVQTKFSVHANNEKEAREIANNLLSDDPDKYIRQGIVIGQMINDIKGVER